MAWMLKRSPYTPSRCNMEIWGRSDRGKKDLAWLKREKGVWEKKKRQNSFFSCALGRKNQQKNKRELSWREISNWIRLSKKWSLRATFRVRGGPKKNQKNKKKKKKKGEFNKRSKENTTHHRQRTGSVNLGRRLKWWIFNWMFSRISAGEKKLARRRLGAGGGGTKLWELLTGGLSVNNRKCMWRITPSSYASGEKLLQGTCSPKGNLKLEGIMYETKLREEVWQVKTTAGQQPLLERGHSQFVGNQMTCAWELEKRSRPIRK